MRLCICTAAIASAGIAVAMLTIARPGVEAAIGASPEAVPGNFPQSLLTNGASCRVEGENAGDFLGFVLAGAFDADNNGHDDLLVGAPHYISDTGRGYVYTFPDSDPQDCPDLEYQDTGTDTFEYFAYGVASVGEVNGDEYDDYIIGARNFSESVTSDENGNSRSDEQAIGAAYVYSGEDGSVLYTFYGSQQDEQLGYSVNGNGDVNDDGYLDFILGGYGTANSRGTQGVAYVWLGPLTEGETYQAVDANLTIHSQGGGSLFGFAVSISGDVNGDGADDILVTATLYPSPLEGKGRVYIFYGDDTWDTSTTEDYDLSTQMGMDDHVDAYITGEGIGDNFGWNAEFIGDFNNDSYDDIVVGASFFDNPPITPNTGRAYVYEGDELFANMDAADDAFAHYTGDLIGDRLGYDVSPAGDVNNDGKDDIIVGAPDWGMDKGQVYVFYGFSLLIGSGSGPPYELDTYDADIEITGSANFIKLGYGVASAGDLDNDGRVDLIVAAGKWDASQQGNDDDRGAVFVFFSSELHQ